MLVVAIIAAIALWIYIAQPPPPPKPVSINFATKYADLL
jgi:hypothetical protein